MSDRRFTLLFFVLVAMAVFLSDNGQIAGDGIVRWEALQIWAEEGRLSEDKYSMAQAVVARPLYEAGKLQAALTGADGQDRVEIIHQWVQRFNKFLVLAFAFWLWSVLRKRAGWTPPQTAFGLLFFLFGSLIIPHAKDFYSELLWTLMSVLAITGLCEKTKISSLLILTGISISVLLNPLLAPVWTVMGLLLFLNGERKEKGPSALQWFPSGRIVQMAAGVVLGLTLMALENHIRRGAFSDFGYPGEGFNTPVLRGLAGQIFAPARGILFFIPSFLLAGLALKKSAEDRGRQDLFRLLAYGFVFSSLLVFAYSKWHAWHGAWYWGPRFLLPLSIFGTLYFLISLEGFSRYSAVKKCTLIVVLLVSFATYKVGAAIGHGPLMECLSEHRLTDTCYWQWEYTPLASWIHPDHLRTLIRHHSSIIVPIAVFLTGLLARYFCEAGEGDKR